MKVQLQSSGADIASWQSLVRRQVGHVLRRLKEVVRHVRVCFEELPHPHTRVTKKCALQVELPDGSTARVEATARTWRGAFDAAVSRLRRTVIGRLQRIMASRANAVAWPPPALGHDTTHADVGYGNTVRVT